MKEELLSGLWFLICLALGVYVLFPVMAILGYLPLLFWTAL